MYCTVEKIGLNFQDRNLTFLKIANLYEMWFHIVLEFSS